MSKFQGVRRISLLVIFSIIAFALLIQVNCVEAGDIGPNQGFDFVTLLAGQQVDVDVTQTGPFGIHSVGILSIGNKKVKAQFLGGPGDTTGLWLIYLVGPPGGHGVRVADASFGLISASEGNDSNVKTERRAFCFVTLGVLIFSPVSSANPYEYKITLSTDAQSAY